MHYSFDVNFNFSIFGLIIFAIIAWGGYRGYQRGAIVMALSLFALLTGLMVSAALTRGVYNYFWQQGSKVPDVFGSVVLGLSFIAVIWFANFILKAVHIRVRDVANDKTNHFVGILFGIAKYFIIVGIYATVILNLDYNGNFLPERDKKSYLLNTSSWVMTKAVKLLVMDFHKPNPIGPENNPMSKPYNQQINFPKNDNNSNTNQDKNKSNNLVQDVDDDNNP